MDRITDPGVVRIDVPEPTDAIDLKAIDSEEDTLELDGLPRELVGSYLLG